MSPRPGGDDWDFTPVINLIHSLSINGEDCNHLKSAIPSTSPDRQVNGNLKEDRLEQVTQLGNFDKIWEFLGQPLYVPPPIVSSGLTTDAIDILETTSGNEQSNLKGVKWRDEHEGGELADNDEIDDSQDLTGLTKSQWKKRRRKRRQAEANGVGDGKALPSGSENESEKEIQASRTPDTKGVIDRILYGTVPEVEPGRLRLGKAFRAGLQIYPTAWPVASPQPMKEPIQILKSPPKENAYAVAAAKKARLMTMLNETFIDDRQYLSNISFTHTSSRDLDGTEEGIHIFVDASNVCSNLLTLYRPVILTVHRSLSASTTPSDFLEGNRSISACAASPSPSTTSL